MLTERSSTPVNIPWWLATCLFGAVALTMNHTHDVPAYGLWSLVIINSAVFILFLTHHAGHAGGAQ